MKNKPINRSFHIEIELEYTEDSCDLDYLNLESEKSLNIIDSFLRFRWYIDYTSEHRWKVIKRVPLYEGEEKIICHPDGEEYTYKVCKKEEL